MKLLIFTDNHFCETSSIIHGQGEKYTTRIENQLESIAWVEDLAVQKGCDAVLCLGDFFDKADLTEQEITAVQDIKWNALSHYFLVGNHESATNGLKFNSTKILEAKNRHIISEPTKMMFGSCEACFLPYIVESDRKSLAEYFGPMPATASRIIFSHNDIKGIQMGPVISKVGFDIDEIATACTLFLNGHLHNGQQVSENAINLGNLTGKDFGEDALKYKHYIVIIDTETLNCELIENPHAFNFYKLEINTADDISELTNLKQNAVLSIKCKEKLVDELRAQLGKLSDRIINSRIIIVRESVEGEAEGDISELTMDHLAKFVECCRQEINNSEALEIELAEICK
jgi:DNA repair exonuclease SbcCD nuclease subunit